MTRRPLSNRPITLHQLGTPAGEIIGMAAKLAVIGLFLIALTMALETGFLLVAPLCLGVVMALILGPFASWLERRGLPHLLVAALVTLSATLGLIAIASGIVVPIYNWIDRTPDIWIRLSELGAMLGDRMREIEQATEQLNDAIGSGDETEVVVQSNLVENYLPALKVAPAVIGQLLIALVTIYFFLATRRDIRAFTLSFATTRATRWRIARVFRDVERGLSHYFRTIALINIGLGCATAAVTWAFGLPNPLLWGGLAALLNFVPYLGPAFMAVILFSVGLVSFDLVLTAVLLGLSFVGLNILEGQIITPSLVGQRLTLNPFLVFVTVSFWLWMWGALGAFLATPFLLIAQVILRHMLPGAAARRDTWTQQIKR